MSRGLVRVTFMGGESITFFRFPSSPARPSAMNSMKMCEDKDAKMVTFVACSTIMAGGNFNWSLMLKRVSWKF
jgi:hypothetical protein